MSETEDPWKDLRRHPRVPALKTARIVYRKATFITECRITDLSEGGAGIELPDRINLPELFDLEIRGGPTRRCLLRWQHGARLGVQFLDDKQAA